ncbi:MAG: MoaD/ThiS family protein [Verrucomicrobiota bacterium]|jgi:molybdopterin converting factor small subunit|nr:MoaD/ThiS family protein [Verrucomicrobiota bacterium]
MTIPVTFWSYFAELAGRPETSVELPQGATVGALLERVYVDHPALAGLRRSTLVAVGVEYQDDTHVLSAGDRVSLFPPVQGG